MKSFNDSISHFFQPDVEFDGFIFIEINNHSKIIMTVFLPQPEFMNE